jgi:hypothetical protein
MSRTIRTWAAVTGTAGVAALALLVVGSRIGQRLRQGRQRRQLRCRLGRDRPRQLISATTTPRQPSGKALPAARMSWREAPFFASAVFEVDAPAGGRPFLKNER